MQIFPSLSKVLRSKSRIFHRKPHLVSTGSPDHDLERELYGMDYHEQHVIRRIMAMAGQAVPVRVDTLAFDRKSAPRYLEKGRRLVLSDTPVSLVSPQDLRVNVFDEKNKYLSIRLSDYLRDIYEDNSD